MIRLSILKLKSFLAGLHINTVAWIASVSFILAINLFVILANAKIKEYRSIRGEKDQIIQSTIESLDSLKNEFNQVIDEYTIKSTIDYNRFNQNLKDIAAQLSIQNRKIEILSGYLTGHQADIQRDFQDLQTSINEVIRIYKRDSVSIKVIKR